ncbi:MAG: hypothetical protein IJS08_19035 [Victivallales bacterium]|nr:hypothetical protein [Victivallales bacterium]
MAKVPHKDERQHSQDDAPLRQEGALSLDLARLATTRVREAEQDQGKEKKRKAPPRLSEEEIAEFIRQLGLEGCMHGSDLAGGFGRVFIARDSRLGRSVAVKVLYKQWEPSRFKREGLSIQTLCGKIPMHANLVTIYASGETKDYFLYSMECANNCAVEGMSFKPDTLTERIDRRRRRGAELPEPSEVIGLFQKLLNGLEVLHSKGLAHLDIKPDNVIFVGDEPKIGDFSLLTSNSVSSELVGGTRWFIPDNPRILEDGSYDGVDQDLFSMGNILYCYVTCNSAKEYSQFPELEDVIPLRKRLFYQKLNNFLLNACNSQEEFRFHSVKEFRENLLACLPVDEKRKQKRAIWGMIGLGLAVVLAGVVAVVKGDGKAVERFAAMPAEALGSINELSPAFGGNLHAKSSYCLGYLDTPERESGLLVLNQDGKPTNDYGRTSRSTVLRLSPGKQFMVPVPFPISRNFEFAFLCSGNTPCTIGVQIVRPKCWWRPEKRLVHLSIGIEDVAFLEDFRVFLQDNRLSFGMNGGKTVSEKMEGIPADASLQLLFSSDQSGDIALSFFKYWEGGTSP